MMSNKNGSNNTQVDPSSDPFAPRPGRTLTWSDVSLTALKNGDDKEILNSLSGSIRPQQLTAIIAHSGAGKTSLLNVLAGKMVSSKNMKVSRTMTLDGITIDPSSINVKRKIAFVAQQDTLLATATPREAIRFSAKLRLRCDMTDKEIDALVDRILHELRIDHVADSITGGENFRGLSGGEMRRLSLGIELVVRPSILFCDEVTSGLDSHNAATVMEVLKRLADCGASVLTTIHQPSSKVFKLIDHLILMNQGRCMYQGSVQGVPLHFSLRGYPIPENYNPADFILEVSQTETVDVLTEAGFFVDSATDGEAALAIKDEEAALTGKDAVGSALNVGFTQSKGSDTQSSSHLSSDGQNSGSNSSSFIAPAPPQLNRNLSIFDTLDASSKASLWTEIRVQAVRDVQKLVRDNRALMLRFMIVIVGSVIISIAFSGAGNNSLESSSAFMGHVGAMFFLIMTNMIALQLIMLDQIETRPIFIREFETDHYRLLSYGCSKIATEALVTFLQVLTLLLIVYWTVGLEASFWNWLVTLYSFSMIMTSTGVALASFTKDARDAKELIPLTLLPQILFCGFFVSTESLPSFLQWMQWIFPLTYNFRILLSQEFAFCLEKDQVLEAGEMCIQSFLDALGTANGRFENIYNAESLVSLTQTGQYRGTTDIAEYFALFTPEEAYDSNALVVNTCVVENSARLQFNGLSDDGVCDLTIVDVTQGEVNPALVLDEYKGTYTEYVFGNRILFTPSPEANQTVDVLTHHIYYPEEFTFGLLGNTFDVDDVVLDICSTLRDQCPSSYERDGYENFEECLTRMKTNLPITNRNAKGLEASDGNSTSCRLIHANLAKENSDHCPHISYFPEVDKHDNYRCSNSYDITFSDLFTPSDLQLFEDVAVEFELDNQLNYGLHRHPNETRSCRSDFEARKNDLQASLQASLPDNVVTTKVCAGYLDMQNATGENNGAYWGALAVMFVFVRGLGLHFLRNLVTK
ncbi:Putative white-brown complex homolog protein 30 [Seminavis robusta]|uniref:White-brown complex homolog protein 30 n=1 Tax=Seminavis robusta TaxID=568900 RepID=A0A9N8DPR2_9STRA|nr:Putative white-brown complex homolog protein 30 [Seminavis robusta]|eukprot:Sro198_g084170.1 Putative white-brown complex homolog protein 30 (979) ;mRNA; f:76384-79564